MPSRANMPYPITEFDNEHSLISPSLTSELLCDLNGIDTCVMTFYPEVEDEEDIFKNLTPLYCFSAGAAEICSIFIRIG